MSKKRAARRAEVRVPVTAAGARTRDALLDAGVTVAAREGLAGLSVNTVVTEAGVAKGTFYVHFPSREAFIDALHKRFYADVRQAITRETEGLVLGPELLARGIDAYLDACLAQRAVKALLFDARSEAHMTETIARREELFVQLVAPNLEAMGWPEPALSARLVVTMTSEVALFELKAGTRLPKIRRALHSICHTARASRSQH